MTVTTTGVKELTAAALTFPGVVRAAARQVDQATAKRVADQARARLNAVTNGTGKTAAAITVTQTATGAQIAVRAVPGRHPLLPLWIEFGTRRQPARPFFTPAVEANRTPHHKAHEAAAEATLRDVFTG